MTEDERALAGQRRHHRVARSWWLWFRPAASTATWQAAPLRDVSAAGARFLSERAFQEGTVLNAKLRLPTSTTVVPLTVRVAWSRPVEGQWGLTEHGVAFDLSDASARQPVLNALRDLSSRSAGG
jgi:hypothetical protein